MATGSSHDDRGPTATLYAMTRADRRHRTDLVVQRRVRQARALDWGLGLIEPDTGIRGRWRRHAPLDCGRPHCGLCTRPRYRDERARRVWTA